MRLLGTPISGAEDRRICPNVGREGRLEEEISAGAGQMSSGRRS
jgi:hypothetical protein